MTFLDLVVIGLAVWRVSSLIVSEDGPFEIFAKIRYFAGVRSVPVKDESGVHTATVAQTQIARGMICLWCVSVWVAVPMFVVSLFPVGRVVVDILALSSIAIIVGEIVSWLHSHR